MLPLQVAAAAAGGSKEEAIPVLVLGTNSLGWVPQRSCQPFTQSSSTAAATAAWAAIARATSSSSSSSGPTSGALAEAGYPLLACIRGLKQAGLWLALGGGQGQQTVGAAAAAAIARGWVQAEGLKAVAKVLLELEGQLPTGAVCNGQCQFWSSWRGAVMNASTPQHMASQVGAGGR
jgi:hypothetical protein